MRIPVWNQDFTKCYKLDLDRIENIDTDKVRSMIYGGKLSQKGMRSMYGAEYNGSTIKKDGQRLRFV